MIANWWYRRGGARWYYRNVYMHSPAWAITKWIRKRNQCEKCPSNYPLHLHHVDYKGYRWYNLLLPDLTSKMQTLCAWHHEKVHKTR